MNSFKTLLNYILDMEKIPRELLPSDQSQMKMNKMKMKMNKTKDSVFFYIICNLIAI